MYTQIDTSPDGGGGHWDTDTDMCVIQPDLLVRCQSVCINNLSTDVRLIHKLTYLGNESVGHDPATHQQGLGLLLPKGEHASLRGVFSLGLNGLGVH